MDIELKRTLRRRILKFAEQYNLDGLVPANDGRSGLQGWGFVRSWGWRGTLSAEDVAVIVGAILEVGLDHSTSIHSTTNPLQQSSYNSRVRALPTPPHSSDDNSHGGLDHDPPSAPDYTTTRFFAAYDALAPGAGLTALQAALPAAQALHRALLRVGSALVAKKQIRHLRAFRMAVVKDGPDVPLFTHPGALVRLAGWVGEAVAILEAEKGRKARKGGKEALVLAALDEGRGVYVVVGVGGGENGWSGGGKKYRTKAEVKEREEKKRKKEEARAVKAAEKARKREEQRRLRRERDAANGILDSDDEGSESAAETESVDSDDSMDSSDSEDDMGDDSRRKKKRTLNRFGQAFSEVVEQTGARVRIDSFEHSVVEVRKEDLGGFLEALSLKTVVG